MIPQQEQQYLTHVLEELSKAYTTTAEAVTQKDDAYKNLQQYTIDYHAELDKMEIYNHQQTLSMIDKQGHAKVLAKKRLEKLIDSPYFGRFDFVYDGDTEEETEAFYIGRFGFSDALGDQLIYDWRAPVCNVFYEYEVGDAAHYSVDKRLLEGTLIRKRQFKIQDSTMIYALDSSLTIQDNVLQTTLAQGATEKMKTIVTSIQREQNKIVRNNTAYTVVIQGVAGSGKTAVALHRIAYLLYKFRDTLRAQDVFILSPNKVFGDYISSVLPELGEQTIPAYTLDELTVKLMDRAFQSYESQLTELIEQPNAQAAKRGSYAFVEQLQAYLKTLDTTLLQKKDLTICDDTISADYLQSRFIAYQQEPVMQRLKLIAEDILTLLKTKRDGQLKLPSAPSIAKRLEKRLHHKSAFAIYKQFVGTVSTPLAFYDVYPYLYCRIYFEGLSTFDTIKHFVLDEMQDYTPIQYAVLMKLFPCKRTIIGDAGQALLPFETSLKKSFMKLCRGLEYVELTTSYRSSYEIMQYAKQFRNANVTPIARHGEEPLEITCTTLEELARTISQKITSSSTAVICKNQQQLELLRPLLALPILDGSTVHFTNEPILTTVQYAKGLEFDTVIIPFKESYTTDYDKGLLYIGCTRAMHELMLLSLIDAV